MDAGNASESLTRAMESECTGSKNELGDRRREGRHSNALVINALGLLGEHSVLLCTEYYITSNMRG